MATRFSTTEELFLDEIRDLYDVEKQLVKALPKMARAASSENLRQAFASHLQETQGHVTRLEQVFKELGKKPRTKKCAAMTGLIAEGEDLIGFTGPAAVRDAGLIATAQKIEHYEAAGYGSARAHAEMLGLDLAVKSLQMTLAEEKVADATLIKLARSTMNEQAAPSLPKTRSVGGGSE